jgi:hypothetical protein
LLRRFRSEQVVSLQIRGRRVGVGLGLGLTYMANGSVQQAGFNIETNNVLHSGFATPASPVVSRRNLGDARRAPRQHALGRL